MKTYKHLSLYERETLLTLKAEGRSRRRRYMVLAQQELSVASSPLKKPAFF